MITRKQLTDEQKRIDAYRNAGKSREWVKSWLRGWRMVGKAK